MLQDVQDEGEGACHGVERKGSNTPTAADLAENEGRSADQLLEHIGSVGLMGTTPAAALQQQHETLANVQRQQNIAAAAVRAHVQLLADAQQQHRENMVAAAQAHAQHQRDMAAAAEAHQRHRLDMVRAVEQDKGSAVGLASAQALGMLPNGLPDGAIGQGSFPTGGSTANSNTFPGNFPHGMGMQNGVGGFGGYGQQMFPNMGGYMSGMGGYPMFNPYNMMEAHGEGGIMHQLAYRSVYFSSAECAVWICALGGGL
jgi:hypothetical protein